MQYVTASIEDEGQDEGQDEMNEDAGPRTAVGGLDILGIMKLIPHRYPFLMIDRIVDIVPGQRATGIKNMTVNEPYFQGHFPRKPIMPGVLIIEAMAQTSAVLVVETLKGPAVGKVVYFMSIHGARFRKPVVPGDRLLVHVTKLQKRRNVGKFNGEARVDGVLMAGAKYSAMIMDD